LHGIPKHLFSQFFLILNFNILPKAAQKYLPAQEKYALYEYYRKSPRELAYEYVHNSHAMVEDQINRLICECSHQERENLEKNLPQNSLPLVKINEKFLLTKEDLHIPLYLQNYFFNQFSIFQTPSRRIYCQDYSLSR